MYFDIQIFSIAQLTAVWSDRRNGMCPRAFWRAKVGFQGTGSGIANSVKEAHGQTVYHFFLFPKPVCTTILDFAISKTVFIQGFM
jgi:hypothetical protein